MKRIVKLIVLMLIIVTICLSFFACESVDLIGDNETYETWISSTEAYDFNGNSNIDEDDFAIYQKYVAWIKSEKSFDYNGDRKIDASDYILLTDFDYWSSSLFASDYDKDGSINKADFEIMQSYYDWRYSSSATDYTGNNIIDYDDYNYEVDCEAWLSSSQAQDVNNDQNIDNLDYNIYVNNKELVGEFKIINFTFTKDVRFKDSKISLTNLKDILQNEVSFEVEIDGTIKCIYDNTVTEKFGNDMQYINDAISNCELKKKSDILYELTTALEQDSTKIEIPFYLKKEVKTGEYANYSKAFSSTLTIKFDNVSSDISFDLVYQDVV